MEPASDRYDELCRLCASYDAVKMDIFGQEGKNRQLVTKIQTCLPFKIAEDDRLPKCLCYRCMYNLENFYDFRTACVNAVALLERCLPPEEESEPTGASHHDELVKIKAEVKAEEGLEVEVASGGGEAYSELRNELLKDKEGLPMMMSEATVVNPNAALGTPPRHKPEHDLDPDEAAERSSCPPDDNLDERDPDEYEMDMETNPSDFLEMSAMVAEEESHQLPQPSGYNQQSSGRSGEQHEVYVCSLCNKAFSSKGHLSLHARIHVGAGDVIGEKVVTDDNTSYKRPYQCDLCSKAYSTAKHRWGHVSTSHRGHPAVTCGYCSRIYSTRLNLEEHVKSKHAGQPPPPELPMPYSQADNRLQCKTCPKMYASVSDLNKHSRTCEQQQQQRRESAAANNNFHSQFGKGRSEPTSDMSSLDSDTENKDYKSAQAKLAKNPQLTILKQALIKGDSVKKEYEERQKMLSNAKKQANAVNKDGSSDAKRWYCEVCPVNFATMDELRQHEKTHDADKPFICILCEKDFVLKSSLSRHILTSHGVDPTPLIESDKCLKKSVIESGMQTSLIKEELNLPKDEIGSPYSDTMDNDEDERENGTENMLEMETVFVCEICTRDFNDRASLWLHIRATHKEFAAFACGVCLKICQDNEQLSNHVNMYHGGSKLAISEQRRYSCTICGRQHDSRKKLITHVSIHNVDPAYDPANFVQLNANYFEPSESNDLIMDCDDESDKVDCYICYKSFPSEDHLIRHQRNAHKNEPMAQAGGEYGNGTGQNGSGSRAQYHLFFVCELCGSSHPSKWERWLHVSSAHCDEPAIRCEREDCEKIFSTKNLRNDHAQHHQLQGSSPNTCEICGKLWGSRVDYWKHMMGVHADTVPLICGVCLKIFPDVMQLSQHVKLKHWPLTNGDFSCDICGRPYSNKSKMSRHRKIHGLDGEAFNPAATNTSLVIHDALNEGPGLPVPMHMDNGLPQPLESGPIDLSCEMCGELKFPSLEELSNHRRVVHSLYPCDLCNKCYGRTSHLWKHVNRVHKGHADITCRYCLKTSASRDHLAAHIAKIHRYEPEVKNDIRDAMAYKTSVSMNQNYSMAMVPPATPDSEEDGLHFCEKCNKSFHKRYLLRRHMKGCQNYRKDPGALLTRCRACERIFKDRASLQKHIENHHSSYECHLCKETVTSKLGIMTHNRMHHMHHPDLTCELESCRKLFRTKEDLESHRKDHKHHGTPNVCDFCGDTVENKLKLKMHILSLHRNEIGVSCGVCLIPMKDPKDLKKHVEDVHNHVLDKPNTCQVCGKQYASKWKAFDHTKKCHGKVFRTCKQCLAVFTTDTDLRGHYEHVHNVPKDQLDAYQYRLEVACKSMEDYDLGPLEVVVKEEPEELDFDLDPFDEDESNDSKRPRSVSDTFDCEICPEIFLNHELLSQHYRNVHNTDPARMFKRLKLDQQQQHQQQQAATGSNSNDAASSGGGGGGKPSKKMRDRENYECGNCQKQFCNKMLYLQHADVCTRKTTSILEAHLKSASNSSSKHSSASQAQPVKREDSAPPTPSPQSESMMCETNLNIPDFNLFEDINMQLSGQKPPVPSLMPLAPHSASSKGAPSSKYSRKDSRKVYDESTNTECSCEVCGKQWPAKKHLWQHLIRFHRAEAAVTCGVCLKLCATYDDLSDHLKLAHPAILSTVGNNFTCKVCGRYHNARSKLLLHMSIHINCASNNACQRCESVFENEDKLKEHLATCTGSKDQAGAAAGAPAAAADGELQQEGAAKQENAEGNEDDDSDGSDDSDDDSSSSNSSNSSSNSSSDDSDASSSGSGSDDDDDDNSSKDSDALAQQQRQMQQQQQQQQQQRLIKSEMMLGTENLALSEDDDEDESADEKPRYEPALSESEDDAYLKKKHAPQPMLSRYSDDDGPPKLYPMMPRPSSDKNDDSQEELASSARRNHSDDDAVRPNEVVGDHGVGLRAHARSRNQGEEQEIEEQEIHGMEHEVGGEEQLEHEEDVEEEQDHEMQDVEEEDEQNVDHDMNDEMLEVDENDMHNLNGTVLMLANDEDGNQILIERNVADLENDDSVHDMAQYVFQDGEGFALEDYEAIVAGQGDEEDEEHRAYEMDIGNHGEQVQEEEIGGEQEVDEAVGEMEQENGADEEQEQDVTEEIVDEAEDDFSAKS